MSFTAYLAADRAHAFALGIPLPDHAHGAALFADISGFTPLTDALARELGQRHGAEELTCHLNTVYNALIAVIQAHGGSAVSFSGDAVTCWFAESQGAPRTADHGPQARQPAAALRAVACGLTLQQTIQQIAKIRTSGGHTVTLALKVAIAGGSVRRLLVGNPAHQQLDVLAGATMLRLAAAEHQAQAGDVVVDAETAAALGAAVTIDQWRGDAHGDGRVAVLAGLGEYEAGVLAAPPAVIASAPGLSFDHARPLLLPAVAARLARGDGDIPTELRPAVALFLRFATLDYDAAPTAGDQLDAYVRWVQGVLDRYGGTLLQVTIGDKGSYLYAAFGAPVAHENDCERALRAALELQAPPPELAFAHRPQIGIARGTMRTGTYGGSGQLTYGALGDAVNIAARLMQAAPAGQMFVQDAAEMAGADLFVWEGLPPLRVKGKPRPIAVFRLLAAHEQPAPAFFQGELVGRAAELERLLAAVQPVQAGQFAGVCVVDGDAGVGKSRLVFELRQRLQERSPLNWAYCPSDEILRGSLRPFVTWLRDYFGQSAERGEADNHTRFDIMLQDLLAALSDDRRAPDAATTRRALAAELDRTRSFLGALVGLRTEGSLYEQVEPKLRFENTLLALTALIQAESLRQPLLLELEDAHWLDEDSQTLLAALTRSLHGYPVAIVCAARPDDQGRPYVPPVADDTPMCAVALGTLTFDGTRTLATQVLHNAVHDELAQFTYERTGGNPFFVEQLLLDLRERGLLERRPMTVNAWPTDSSPPLAWSFARRPSSIVELPGTLNSLLVARLDRLAEPVREVVQTAAVLGREWALPVLAAMRSGDDALPPKVRAAEAGRIWSPLNERDYLFRHVLLRDAAYDMQARERLRALHQRAVGVIEQEYAENLAPHYDALAYHARAADDHERERRYARLAGEQAAARYANVEAIAFFSRALELTPEEDLDGRWDVLVAREKVYSLVGKRAEQSQDILELEQLAQALNNGERQVQVALAYSLYFQLIGNLPQSAMHAQSALAAAETIHLPSITMQSHHRCSVARLRLGDYEGALQHAEASLHYAQQAHEKRGECRALIAIAGAHWMLGHATHVTAFLEQAQRIARHIEDRQLECYALANLGRVAASELRFVAATTYLHQSLALAQQIGDRYGEMSALEKLGIMLHYLQGESERAQGLIEQAHALARALGDQSLEATTLSSLCLIATSQGAFERAFAYGAQALELLRMTGNPNVEADIFDSFGLAHLRLGQLAEAHNAYTRSLHIRQQQKQEGRLVEAQAGLARVALAQRDLEAAQAHAESLLATISHPNSLNGAEDPIPVYLACYDVLRTVRDSRADQVLTLAHALLQERADKIADEAVRRMFLEHVPHHRELVAAWQAAHTPRD